MSRNIFGEFIKKFLIGLNPYKIQIIFKLDLLLNFIIQNPEELGSWAKNESCPF
jgi:hypothetical protein